MKKIFFAAFMTTFAGSAFAQSYDITSPLFMPKDGQLLSTTRADYDRNKVKSTEAGAEQNFKMYQKLLLEELRYGLSDHFSLDAMISNTWEKNKGYTNGFADVTGEENTNIDFSFGVMADFIDSGNTYFQLGTYYVQRESNYDDGSLKLGRFVAQVGKDLGVFMPYVSAFADFPFEADKDDPHEQYNVRVGLHRLFPYVVSVDAAVNFNHDCQYNANEWRLDLAADYFVDRHMTLGAYGQQVLHDAGSYGSRAYEQRMGVRFKKLF